MDRRGFLGSILAAAVAPAIVRADSLMRIVPIGASIIVPSQAIALPEITAALIGMSVQNDIRTDALLASFDLLYRLPDGKPKRAVVTSRIAGDQHHMLGIERGKAAAILEAQMHKDFGSPLPASAKGPEWSAA